jgi:hypothetical protein
MMPFRAQSKVASGRLDPAGRKCRYLAENKGLGARRGFSSNQAG